jgi:hypothetical protein
MSYDTRQEALDDGRCGYKLSNGGYCGCLPLDSFVFEDVSISERCKHHCSNVERIKWKSHKRKTNVQ